MISLPLRQDTKNGSDLEDKIFELNETIDKLQEE